MTIEFRTPLPAEEPRLRELFTEAFADEGFTDLFFRTGFSPDRCLAAFDADLLAALHWFDCTLDGKPAAYVYGIASFASCQGRGIGSALIRHAIDHLRSLGFDAIVLVPAEGSLFGYYERFGFRTVSTIGSRLVRSGEPAPVQKLNVSQYAALRRSLLPEHGIIQEGACLEVLAGYADFYATANAVAAVGEGTILELLGDEGDAPGILAALGYSCGVVRTPGEERPFAMGIGIDAPIYLGLALD